MVGERVNGWSEDELNVGHVRHRAQRVLNLLAPFEDSTWAVEMGDVTRIVEAYQKLSDLELYLPKVKAWAVVKRYADRSWHDRTWVACLSEEQANQYRDALEAHYDRFPDTWVVEFLPVRVLDIMSPDMAASEYIARMG